MISTETKKNERTNKKSSMEAIKQEIHTAVTSAHGSCTLQLIVSDLCICVCVHQYEDYVLYIRPDDRQTHFLCHYAHREDLLACVDVSAEMEAWKQQAVLQMPRKVQGGMRHFVKVACDYVKDAVQRMETRRGVSGRGAYVKVKTFEEAKLEALFNPKPHRAVQVLPPPVCRRHLDVHREAEKKRRMMDGVKRQKEERDSKACGWGQAIPKKKDGQDREDKK